MLRGQISETDDDDMEIPSIVEYNGKMILK
jgi:hypothetical protein